MSYGTSSLNGGPLLSLEMEFCSQDDTPEEIVHHGEQLESKPIEQESTFNPWLVVDIVGSPDLTRLIGALTIDLCEEIPGLDLSTESSEESQDACKLMNPYKGCSSTITYKAQGQLSPLKTTPPSVPFSIAAFSIYSSKQSWHRMPGPLDEFYLFPSPTQSKRLLETPRTDHLVSGYSLNMKELECRTRVKALKSMNRSEIIKLVNEMRSIAWRYYEIERFGSAETWWRRVVTSCMEIPGYEPIKVLQACLYVVNNARLQGRYEEALGLFQPIYQKTMTLIGPDHELAMLSKFILAGLWDELGEKELGMATVRDLLQISLLRFGTRSRETLRALISLGYSLCSFGQYREAEAIFSICVELNCEICHYADRDTIDIHNGIESRTALARVLNQQRRYEDCKTLLQTTNGYFMDLIRVEKPSCWEYFHQKARVLKYEGRLRESEEILRAILKHAPNYPDFTITLTMMELAEVLMESGQEEEVITWWESIFSMTVKLFGIEHRISRYRSMKLGFSYADRGRFDDAILHFQQDMEKLAPSDLDDPGSRDDYIQDLHCWIDEVVWMKRKMKMGEMMEV
jgi:tetratricopeptide (TPR) repeat protein